MISRTSFSNENQEIATILNWFKISKTSLSEYKERIKKCIQVSSNVPDEFIGLSLYELEEYFSKLEEELENITSLNLLAAVEAKLRIDYLDRVYNRKKDKLSREFQNIYKIKENKASLEEDILELWKNHFPELKKVISEYKSALKYRNWLAHGRYWTPKIGRKYDFDIIFSVCENILENLGLNKGVAM